MVETTKHPKDTKENTEGWKIAFESREMDADVGRRMSVGTTDEL